MSNLLNNRLNVVATEVEINAVIDAINTINAKLPFLLGLTVSERVALPSIDVANKAFTEDAINAALANPDLVPSYMQVSNIEKDITLFNQLDRIKVPLKQLLEKIEDTQLLAGSEAYMSALALYRLIGSAADAGVPGADSIYDQLKRRFAGQGGTGTPAQPTAE